MTQRPHFGSGVKMTGPGLAALLMMLSLAGCDYSAPETVVTATPGTYQRGSLEAGAGGPGGSALDISAVAPEDREVILKNVIELIRTAVLKPGGDNFRIATENLNQYFSNTSPSEFLLKPDARAFLLEQMPRNPEAAGPGEKEVAGPEEVVRALEAPSFGMPDARHIEDCMLYHGIATRVGGAGDDLARARRVFRWVMEQVELVPAGSLGAPGLGQAFARPYDVLVRGMATEAGGIWAERGWLFMVLCRQLGIDVGMLTYTPPQSKAPVIWTTAALIDGELYLFDARIGLEVPGPGGEGVATLDDALNDPSILAGLDLPGQLPYFTTREALLNSASKIGVQLDSSPDYRSPRMALLQGSLAGKDRTLLYRDPLEERDGFARALGEHAGGITFWALPAMVEYKLFNDPRFVEATKHALVLFDPNYYPLVYARIRQLRGEIPQAVEEYVAMRKVARPTLVDKKTPMPMEIQEALDVYATYFLGLCHLEQDHPDLAEQFFKETLRTLPEFGAGQPYFHLFRRGAATNLARLSEARGDAAQAIAYYTLEAEQDDPTTQQHGNLIRARELVWRDPTAPPVPVLPPAPSPLKAPALIAAPPGQGGGG